MTEPMKPSTGGPDLATRLAFERTRLAFERTMLSWIRTGTSMITFGFGVYKFFQIEAKPATQDYIIGYQQFGLILVAIGLLALALGALEYRENMRELNARYQGKSSWRAMLFGGSVAGLGILAFVAMMIRQ